MFLLNSSNWSHKNQDLEPNSSASKIAESKWVDVFKLNVNIIAWWAVEISGRESLLEMNLGDMHAKSTNSLIESLYQGRSQSEQQTVIIINESRVTKLIHCRSKNDRNLKEIVKYTCFNLELLAAKLLYDSSMKQGLLSVNYWRSGR